ncbi:DnaJ domain-containing protein [Oscillatoriales cyanobacterium LEGE 11467]|uniref:DnaJ domain-containing protein n=2 Tax=Zarconia TaxID=2992130 RepID=A0A928VXQ1_9CYAN|nr:DnaJ domain-containing protein [Zarconia navalis LEGE 11467]
MSFDFDRGLFKSDFFDHHAVLGMPIDASAREIRKRFMSIARRLHPDICKAEDKGLAEALLSKLVNPAYAKLSNDRERDEYVVLLKMMGKRLIQDRQSISLGSDLAKQLSKENNFERAYKNALETLATKQYEDLDGTLDTIAQMSELNLVYLLRKERDGGGVKKEQKTVTRPPVSGPPTSDRPTSEKRESAYIDRHCQRAEGLMTNNNLNSLTMARKELQDALKLDANNSRVHALMGTIYLKQNQLKPSSVNITLAKKHVTQALKLNVKEPVALEARKQLNQLLASSSTGGQKTGTVKGKSDKSSGGLFGGLFGGKKK